MTAELVRRIGGLQVRNAGTIVGNVANGSPIGDSPPLLVTALTTDSSTSAPEGSVRVYTDVDMRLIVGDLLAKLRLHEAARAER